MNKMMYQDFGGDRGEYMDSGSLSKQVVDTFQKVKKIFLKAAMEGAY